MHYVDKVNIPHDELAFNKWLFISSDQTMKSQFQSPKVVSSARAS